MPVVTFWAADFCCNASPISYLFPKPGPAQPILWTHSICYREISSQDKLAKLHFQFFLRTLIGIFSKLATVGVVNQGEVCDESLVAWGLLDYVVTDVLWILTDQVKTYL